MKTFHWMGILTAGLLVLGASSSEAQTTATTGTAVTNDGTFTNVVLNSTYAFTGVGTGGGTATLDQTLIPRSDLNGLIPPVSFNLTLSSISYSDTQDTFVGTGVAPTITFDLAPRIDNLNGGNFPSEQITLTAPVIASGQHATDVVFTLQNPVAFPVEGQMNPVNLDYGSGTFTAGFGNFQPSPASLTLAGASLASGQTIQLNSSDFALGGSIEIVYAVPEPRSAWLALLAATGLAGLLAVRRRAAQAD